MTVRLTRPWELGPVGPQTVRVLAKVPDTGTITLERTGSSIGPIRMDLHGFTLSLGGKTEVTIAPAGPITWRGYTTMSRGIILADSMLAQRNVTLRAKNGRTYRARERMIMLLNAVPGDT